MLSDMEPALSPLPPSPDREGLGDSSSSEEESRSGRSSEDDGSGNEDEDSDYSLGDLADILIGDHGEIENLAVSPMKTRSSDQDIHEDVENSETGQETTTKNDADCAKTESEFSVRQSPNKASASDIEVSENPSLANCNVVNPGGETSKCLTKTQEGSIEVEMNENSHIAGSDISGRKKTDDESGKTEDPSNAEKCTVVTPSPQRKTKRRMASPKPRVMTRARAKAMKLSSSSDAESSSERETRLDVISTQENLSEVSDTTGVILGSYASDLRKSNDDGTGNNEHVSVASVDNTKEFTTLSQANEIKEHGEGHSQGFLSDSSNFDADDASHHHGNLCELVYSAASRSDLKDQDPTEGDSNVLVGTDTDVVHQRKKNGELSCSGTLLTDSENQGSNEDNSNALLVGIDKDVIHTQRHDGQPACSTSLLSDSEKQVVTCNEDNSNVSVAGLDTDVIHEQRNDGQFGCSATLLTDSEKQAGKDDNSNVSVNALDTDVIHQQRNDGRPSCSGALLTDSEEQVLNEDISNALSVGMDTDTIHQQRNDGRPNCSGALLTDSEEQVLNEDISNALSVGMDTDTIHQQRNGGRLGCSGALLTDSEEQVLNEDISNALSVGIDTDTIHQQRNGGRLGCSGALLTDSEEQVLNEDISNALSVGIDTDTIHQQRNGGRLGCSGALLTDSEEQVLNEDISNALSVGMDTDTIHQQRNDGRPSCSGALLTDSEEQVLNEDISNALSVGMDTDIIHQQRNGGRLGCSAALHTDAEKQAGNEDNSNVSVVGLDTDVIHQQRNNSQLSCPGAVLTDPGMQVGNEDNSNALLVGMDTDAIHRQRNDSQLGCSAALHREEEKQADSEDNSNVSVVGLNTDFTHQQRNDSRLSCSTALLTDSEKQAGDKDNANVLLERNDGQLSCSDTEEQVGNEDGNLNVFTGGQEVDCSRLGDSTALLSEQVANEDNPDASLALVSKATENVPTEAGIEIDQEISTTSECGSKFKGGAPVNLTNEENPNINDIPLLELKNESVNSILANGIINEENTEGSQTLQDSKITSDFNGNTLPLQLQTKEKAFKRREDTLGENNSNISEEASPEQLEVGCSPVSDTDSSDQTQPFVCKNQNHTICKTERKSSELSTTCDGTTNEDRSKKEEDFPSNKEIDADSFPCIVRDKSTASTSVETSQGDPADVSSSTVEIDFNISTLTSENKATMTTTSATETAESSSTKSPEDETSEDKLSLKEEDHSHASDEAMQSCSIDEHEGNDSKGQDSNIQENIPILTTDSLRKNSELEKDESFSSDGKELLTCNEGSKNSVWVKDVLSFETLNKKPSEPSTSNEIIKESDCVRDVPAFKTAIKEASEPSTINGGRKNSDYVKDVRTPQTVIEEGNEEFDWEKDGSSEKSPSTTNGEKRRFDKKNDFSSRVMSKGSSSSVNETRKHSDMARYLSTTIGEESSSTFNEGKRNSPLGRDVSSRAIFCERSAASIHRKRNTTLERNVSSRAMDNESCSTFNEGRKYADMGRDAPCTAMAKESCLTVGRDVSSRADFCESPLTSIKGKRNSSLERNASSRAVGIESSSSFDVGKRNPDLGKDVFSRITSKEGSSSNENEMLAYVDVRVPSTFNKERKHYVINRDISSRTTVAEQAEGRKTLSSSLLDAEESKFEERGLSWELPSSPIGAGLIDDSPPVGDLMDDSPMQTLFNNLEGLLDEFPALSPLPPSPSPSDDEECSTAPISRSNLNKEKSNRVTGLTSTKKTFDSNGKWEFNRDGTVNYTEVVPSRSVKRKPLEKSATMCITESNKLDISITPRNRLAKENTSKSVSTPCSRGSASIKRPLQRSESTPSRAEEIISRKRSYQQSVGEPVKNNNAVLQKGKKMRTQPKIPHKEETSSLESRLDISRVPVEKATFSQQTKNNDATKGPVMVDRKGPILADNKEPKLAGKKGPILAGKKAPKLAGDEGPILAGTKVPILAGKKAPKLAGNKGPILAESEEPILVDDDGPLVDFNEGPVLEEGSKNTKNSVKATGNKHSKYRPLSVRPGYMPEVKYVFKCLSRVHEDNVDLHVVVERLTTKRCISSSTPVASAIIQFLKGREDDLIPQVLDQLEHFQTDASPNNWQPVISSFESRLLEVISLLSNNSLFGNIIPRLISLCSRSLTEIRCSSSDEEVVKGNLSLW